MARAVGSITGRCYGNELMLLSCRGGRRQRAKKVVSDSPGLVDFAIGLVIFILNLPDRQVLFFGENSNYRRIVINPANQKRFWAG